MEFFLLQHLAALFPGRLASLVIKLSQVIHNLDHRVEADKVFERGGIYSWDLGGSHIAL